MYIVGMDGNAKIRWDTCDTRKFRHDPIFLEAMECGTVKTLHDLAVFLDDTTVLDYMDTPVIEAILEINRNLYDCVDVPIVYYYTEQDHALMFFPRSNEVYLGVLDGDPEVATWTYVSIKSML